MSNEPRRPPEVVRLRVVDAFRRVAVVPADDPDGFDYVPRAEPPACYTPPAGWRLVPVEPDDRMQCAGFESDEWDRLSSLVLESGGWPYSCKESAECVAGIFRAMTDAAPAFGSAPEPAPSKSKAWDRQWINRSFTEFGCSGQTPPAKRIEELETLAESRRKTVAAAMDALEKVQITDRALLEAANALIDHAAAGHECNDGERAWLVHDDYIHRLKEAISQTERGKS